MYFSAWKTASNSFVLLKTAYMICYIFWMLQFNKCILNAWSNHYRTVYLLEITVLEEGQWCNNNRNKEGHHNHNHVNYFQPPLEKMCTVEIK